MSTYTAEATTVVCGGLRLEWTEDGEGYNGDYNLNDPDDASLFRFTVSEYSREANGYVYPEDCSYCTLIRAEHVKDDQLLGYGRMILQLYKDSASPSRTLEALSWLEI